MYRRPFIRPLWDITEADWQDWSPNLRLAVFDAGTGTPTDDAVLDKETGLVWERSPATDKKASWNAAIVYSYTKVVGRDTSNVAKTAPVYVWLVRGGFGHDYSY